MSPFLNRLYPVRYTAFALCVLGLLLALAYFAVSGEGGWAVVFALLVALGVDLRQDSHAILRNYPVIGNLRFVLEYIRPEIRCQYFIDPTPMPRRFARPALAGHQRAKGTPTIDRWDRSSTSRKAATSGSIIR